MAEPSSLTAVRESYDTVASDYVERVPPPDTRIRRLIEENQQLREQLARALGEQRAAMTHTASPRADASGPGSAMGVAPSGGKPPGGRHERRPE